jgi:hypothetical protein
MYFSKIIQQFLIRIQSSKPLSANITLGNNSGENDIHRILCYYWLAQYFYVNKFSKGLHNPLSRPLGEPYPII